VAPTTHAVGGEPVTPARIVPATPEEIRIDGAKPIPRTIHYDARGFLLETLRRDDDSVNGSKFAMSYTSATVSHAFRDRDRWHAHRIQSDRFLVVLGEMTLALYDARPTSRHTECSTWFRWWEPLTRGANGRRGRTFPRLWSQSPLACFIA